MNTYPEIWWSLKMHTGQDGLFHCWIDLFVIRGCCQR